MADDVRTFSWAKWIGGFILVVFVCGILNVVAGMVGVSTNMAMTAALIGAIPGVLAAMLSRALPRNGFAEGVLVGGCLLAILGGACAASMVGMSFR